MEPSDLLVFLAEEFDRLKISYFVTGSMATIFFGEPRLTNDVDVVVRLELSQVAEFAESFPEEEFYRSIPMMESAVRCCGQFNIIHPKSGLKVDVIVASESEFNHSRFSRRSLNEVAEGKKVWFASPEDVILKKLVYYDEGGSEKHIRDILGVLQLQENSVDIEYISEWASRLDLLALWQDVLIRLNTDDANSNNVG